MFTENICEGVQYVCVHCRLIRGGGGVFVCRPCVYFKVSFAPLSEILAKFSILNLIMLVHVLKTLPMIVEADF